MRRQLLCAAVAAQPWAMAPEHLAVFASVLRRWSAGLPATPGVMADVQSAQAARAARTKANASVGSGIAVLPLYGVLSQRASMVDDVSGAGGTSTQVFVSALRAALADDTVSGIIIDLDSPGGSVFGTSELGMEIFNARKQKPIFGYVNSLCASAAYWVGSQCEQLYMTPGGQCGSIGVYMTHVDESAAMEMEGLKAEFIFAGANKVEGNSLGPLQDEARAFLQSQVDSYFAMFTSAVAKGRGVPVASVRDGMGQGRCLMAADALAANMVDGVCSLDDVVSKMCKTIKGTRAHAAAESFDIVVEAPNAGIEVVAESVTTARRFAARRRELEIAGV